MKNATSCSCKTLAVIVTQNPKSNEIFKTKMKDKNNHTIMSTTNNTQSNYFWTIFNLVLIVSFLLIFQANAQQKMPLPQNAKLKTIKFNEFNYAVKGYVINENFVEGQKITFLETEEKEIDVPIIGGVNSNTLTDTIISGIYFIKDDISYLEGKKEEIKEYRNRTKKRIVTKGLFKISNSVYKNASEYEKLNDKVSIKDERSVLSVSPLTKDKYWQEIRKNLNKLPITLLTATSLEIEIVDVYSYQGYLETNTSLTSINVQKQGDNYNLKIDFRDRTLETIISYDALKKNNLLDFNFDNFSYLNKIIENSKNEKLTFKNGNIFTGKVYYNEYIYNPNEGEYRFTNGDIVFGQVRFDFDKADLAGYYNLGLNKDSKTTFADGNVVYGDWAEKYEKMLPSNEWNEILKNSKTLTEVRDKCENNEKYQNSVLEQKRKQQDAKIAKKENQIAELEYKNTLIKKYGTNWGNLIFQKVFTLGMTKEMVLEFTYGKAYKISEATRDGKYIEIWEFDPQKFAQEIAKKEGATALSLLSMYEEIGMIDIKSKFPNLIFTDNKLSAILQH
jgi:hypothetical protein